MNRIRLAFLLAFLFLVPAVMVCVQSQTATVGTSAPALKPVRDPGALATVTLSVSVLGGSALSQVQDSIAQGKLEPAPGSNAQPADLTWRFAGSEFRLELRTGASTRVFVSGHGQPASVRDGKTRALNLHMADAILPLHLPGLALLNQLNNPKYSITVIGNELVAGLAAIRIRTSLDVNPLRKTLTLQEWLLDAATGLPLRLTYRLPDNMNPEDFTEQTIDFSDFRSVGGIVTPFRMTVSEQGVQRYVVTLQSVSINSGSSPSEFDAPAGGGR